MTTIEDENIKSLLSTWGLAARVCDSCCTATAVLHCQAHTAFLCSTCDSTLHLQARHERILICDVCQQAPASLTCNADAANLCSSCDRDIHAVNPLASRHQRLPVVPLVGPTGTIGGGAQETDTWLIPNPDLFYHQNNEQLQRQVGNGEYGAMHKAIIPSLTVPYSFIHEHNGGDCGVSNDYQLNNNGSLMSSCFDIDLYPSNKIHHQQVISAFNNYAAQPSVSSSSDVAVVPEGNSNFISAVSNTSTMTKTINTVTGEQVSPATAPEIDRQARVMRFKEKRKNRKFEKTIRYASRKAYAEARPRNKGRFTKRTELNEMSDNDDQVFGFRLGSDWFPDEMLDTVSLHNFHLSN